ncbi:hypothetical protein P4O66_000391 [Electrophorus voltai]|uniref:Uncharacterized protein n=1 Tax=Electrophorus voltai TaxID=2609070 RepID=A0AAD8ZIA5_9TELE|nr:hypothetical protein P4O66_000391 [Electrophorus voltai]
MSSKDEHNKRFMARATALFRNIYDVKDRQMDRWTGGRMDGQASSAGMYQQTEVTPPAANPTVVSKTVLVK